MLLSLSLSLSLSTLLNTMLSPGGITLAPMEVGRDNYPFIPVSGAYGDIFSLRRRRQQANGMDGNPPRNTEGSNYLSPKAAEAQQ